MTRIGQVCPASLAVVLDAFGVDTSCVPVCEYTQAVDAVARAISAAEWTGEDGAGGDDEALPDENPINPLWMERQCVLAVSCGLSQEQFWAMTPRELRLQVEGASDKAQGLQKGIGSLIWAVHNVCDVRLAGLGGKRISATPFERVCPPRGNDTIRMEDYRDFGDKEQAKAMFREAVRDMRERNAKKRQW